MTRSGLSRDETIMAVVMRSDVWFIEEIGMCSSEYIDSLDNFYRQLVPTVTTSNKPFGGRMVCASGDPAQLPPVDGHMIWTSPAMLTCFKILLFEPSVRFNDKQQEELVKLLEKGRLTETHVARVVQIISDNCTFHETEADGNT